VPLIKIPSNLKLDEGALSTREDGRKMKLCDFDLHNKEFHILYSSPNIIRQIKSRIMRWAGHVARMGKQKKVYSVLVGKPERKRPLGIPRRRWEDGIRMDLREIGWENVEWIQLAQDRGW
jgi:hypothetical protein